MSVNNTGEVLTSGVLVESCVREHFREHYHKRYLDAFGYFKKYVFGELTTSLNAPEVPEGALYTLVVDDSLLAAVLVQGAIRNGYSYGSKARFGLRMRLPTGGEHVQRQFRAVEAAQNLLLSETNTDYLSRAHEQSGVTKQLFMVDAAGNARAGEEEGITILDSTYLPASAIAVHRRDDMNFLELTVMTVDPVFTAAVNRSLS